MLADKERTIKQLQIDNKAFKKELNKAEEVMEQLKMSHSSVQHEQADCKTEMDEKMRVMEEALKKLKEELTMKQNTLDIAVSKYLAESDGWLKKIQEQLDKIKTLENKTA